MTNPPWMQHAIAAVGTQEITGPQHNKTIIQWLIDLGSWVRDDETAWCGTFVAAMLKKAGLPIVTNYKSARAWAKYGARLLPDRLAPGAIIVFWRGSRSGWQGHVGFYVGEDATHYHILGGNQSERDPATGRLKHTGGVNIQRINKDRYLASRWPRGVPVIGGPVRLAKTAAAASNGNEA